MCEYLATNFKGRRLRPEEPDCLSDSELDRGGNSIDFHDSHAFNVYSRSPHALAPQSTHVATIYTWYNDPCG